MWNVEISANGKSQRKHTHIPPMCAEGFWAYKLVVKLIKIWEIFYYPCNEDQMRCKHQIAFFARMQDRLNCVIDLDSTKWESH